MSTPRVFAGRPIPERRSVTRKYGICLTGVEAVGESRADFEGIDPVLMKIEGVAVQFGGYEGSVSQWMRMMRMKKLLVFSL